MKVMKRWGGVGKGSLEEVGLVGSDGCGIDKVLLCSSLEKGGRGEGGEGEEGKRDYN